jgi:ferredoxin
MALLINDDCIICHACLPECPNNAIYENGEKWSYSDGTALKEIELEDGTILPATVKYDPVTGGTQGADGNIYYYIVPSKCTECTGFHEEPMCAAVCPTDACVPDPDNEENREDLLLKKEWLHGG